MTTTINISGGSNDTNLVLNSAHATVSDGANAADSATFATARVTHEGTGDTPACAKYTFPSHTGNSRCLKAASF